MCHYDSLLSTLSSRVTVTNSNKHFFPMTALWTYSSFNSKSNIDHIPPKNTLALLMLMVAIAFSSSEMCYKMIVLMHLICSVTQKNCFLQFTVMLILDGCWRIWFYSLDCGWVWIEWLPSLLTWASVLLFLVQKLKALLWQMPSGHGSLSCEAVSAGGDGGA